jgi:transcriptional regulator with AAA-type ATPase domain
MSSDPAARLTNLLEQCRDAIFLLNQRQRFLFVNAAWEKLTEIPQAEARRLSCNARAASLGMSAEDEIRRLCSPPPEVLKGKSVRIRRLRPDTRSGSRWWEIDFLPLGDVDGATYILGRIEPVLEEQCPAGSPAGLLGVRTSKSDFHSPAIAERLAQMREGALARYRLDAFDTSHAETRRSVEQARLAAQNRYPVLLQGEAGTGKEWLARAIHNAGPAREQTFIALDCEQLPPACVSEVFYGEHVLEGRLAVGTLYLREPGFLPREFQARLVEFVRETTLPSSRLIPLPRVVAGTRFPPPAGSADTGRLHEDLYHALAVQTISLVPLRQRPADLPALVELFSARLREGDPKPLTLTPAAVECLRHYTWPENLRELLAVLASARQQASGSVIDVSDLPTNLRLTGGVAQATPAYEERGIPLEQLLEEAERRLILLALSRCAGNKTRAAEMLSIFRPRLLRRMEALGIADPSAITEENG